MGYLAVSASFSTIIVWDVGTGKVLRIIVYPSAKTFVCFALGGKQIISSDGNSLFIWDDPPFQRILNETREQFKNGCLTDEEKKQYYLE